MLFRRVGPGVLDGPGGASRAVVHGSDWKPSSTNGRNRSTMLAFAAAWMAHDWDVVRSLAGPDLSCRWTGFGYPAVTATGLDELIEHGLAFERRHGTAARYDAVETMGGEHHAAILFRPGGGSEDADLLARVAVYRIKDGKVVEISVYADSQD